MLGSPVGSLVGSPVGSFVGSFVGSLVGSLVGSVFGSLVGLLVGSVLGSVVGSVLVISACKEATHARMRMEIKKLTCHTFKIHRGKKYIYEKPSNQPKGPV